MLIDRWICSLTGHHAALRQFGEGRMWLHCQCGWTSKGWQVGKVPSQRVIWLREQPARPERRRVNAA